MKIVSRTFAILTGSMFLTGIMSFTKGALRHMGDTDDCYMFSGISHLIIDISHLRKGVSYTDRLVNLPTGFFKERRIYANLYLCVKL